MWEIGRQDLVDPQLQTSGDATSRTNQALLRFRQQVLEPGGDASNNYKTTLANVSGRLSQLRKDAQAHASKTASPAAAKHANDIFDRYTVLVGQLLDADQRSGHTIDDAQLRSGAELLNAIARQNDVEKQIAVKGILATVSQDAATASQVERLAGVQAAGDAELRVRGDGRVRAGDHLDAHGKGSRHDRGQAAGGCERPAAREHDRSVQDRVGGNEPVAGAADQHRRASSPNGRRS